MFVGRPYPFDKSPGYDSEASALVFIKYHLSCLFNQLVKQNTHIPPPRLFHGNLAAFFAYTDRKEK